MFSVEKIKVNSQISELRKIRMSPFKTAFLANKYYWTIQYTLHYTISKVRSTLNVNINTMYYSAQHMYGNMCPS